MIRLVEISRVMPQYGYALAEISKSDQSDLAQHHYLVTFIAWSLARIAQKGGSKVEVQKVLEYALIHDLGELFGGDIAMPYARANNEARTAAKQFERLNQQYLSRFFDDPQYFDNLSAEILSAESDESLIAKLADYIELTHYKQSVQKLSFGDLSMTREKVFGIIQKIKCERAKTALLGTVNSWLQDMSEPHQEIFEAHK